MSDQPNQNSENQEQQPSYTPASPLKRTLAWVGLVYMLAFVGLNLYPFFSGGQYLRGYILDCALAGIHFSFSGYFCARGRSEFSFLHNIISLCLARLPGAYLTSLWFPASLLPMGLATAAGSLVSVLICLIAYRIITRKDPKVPAAA